MKFQSIAAKILRSGMSKTLYFLLHATVYYLMSTETVRIKALHQNLSILTE